MDISDRRLSQLSAHELHDLLKLRVDVFIVEQACPYPELDGRDDDPSTRHVWIADERGPTAYARLLDDGDVRRIGRVATRFDARGEGLAGRLVDHLLATSDGPWLLDAQTRLQDWYRGRGFVVTGPEFIEDGIPHVPMHRRL
jgi:ElaA protein